MPRSGLYGDHSSQTTQVHLSKSVRLRTCEIKTGSIYQTPLCSGKGTRNLLNIYSEEIHCNFLGLHEHSLVSTRMKAMK